jgi:hypothetical protein
VDKVVDNCGERALFSAVAGGGTIDLPTPLRMTVETRRGPKGTLTWASARWSAIPSQKKTTKSIQHKLLVIRRSSPGVLG